MSTLTESEIESIENTLLRKAIDHASYKRLVLHLNTCLERFAQAQKSQFKPGDRVTWKSRDGAFYTGTICKINQKNIDIKRDPIIKDGIAYPQGITRAHPSLLQRA